MRGPGSKAERRVPGAPRLTVERRLPRPLDWSRTSAYLAWLFIGLYWVAILQHGSGADARVLHAAWDGPMYGETWHQFGYVFSPAFAQITYPLTLLPFGVYFALLATANIAAVVWCAGPRLGALLLVTPPVVAEIALGNINILLGAAIVLGFRHPSAWAFVLLTKVTPGVGLLWFVFRRKWRDLGIALGTTAAIVAVSAALAPNLWTIWIERLAASSSLGPNPTAIVLLDLPLTVRLTIGAALIAVAAWKGWRWLALLSAFIAQPAVTMQRTSMLVAAIRLFGHPSILRRTADHLRSQSGQH